METGEKVIIALVVLVTVGVIGGAAVMMPIMMEEMHKPESCSKMCHEMQPFYDSLVVSAHGRAGVMDCHECHRPEGLPIGHGIAHIKGIVASEIEDEIPEAPKNEYCMECHEQYPEGHKEHITWMGQRFPEYSGYECIICHDDHRITVKPESCIICHPISK